MTEVAASEPNNNTNNSSNIMDTVEEDDDSYVPASLRNFLEEADKKLDNDLADLLAPIHSDDKSSFHPQTQVPNLETYEYDEDDDGEDNTIFYNILQKETDEEMKRQLAEALNKQQQMQQQQQEEKREKEDQLAREIFEKKQLDEWMAKEVAAQQAVEEEEQRRSSLHRNQNSVPDEHIIQESSIRMTPEATRVRTEHTPEAAVSVHLQEPTPMTDKRDTDDALQEMMNPPAHLVVSDTTPRSNTKNAKGKISKKAPSPLKQLERKLQKELDREAKRSSIGTPQTPTSGLGLRRRNNRVAPSQTTAQSQDQPKTAASLSKQPSQLPKRTPSPASKSNASKPKDTSHTKPSNDSAATSFAPTCVPTGPRPSFAASQKQQQFIYESNPSRKAPPKAQTESMQKAASPPAALLEPETTVSDAVASTAPLVSGVEIDGSSTSLKSPLVDAVEVAPASELASPVVESLEVVPGSEVSLSNVNAENIVASVKVDSPNQQRQPPEDVLKPSALSESAAEMTDQVFTIQGPVSAHHGTPPSSDVTKNALQNINESVFTAQDPAPARRAVLSPADERMRRLNEFKTYRRKSPATDKSAASPQPFKARPAPTFPKPKQISFHEIQGEISSNRSVSPLHGGPHPPAAVVEISKTGPVSPMLSSPLNPRLLEPTVSSRQQATSKAVSKRSTSPVSTTTRGRRPLTRPDRSIGRLTKPTSASMANTKNAPKVMMLSRKAPSATAETAKISNSSRLMKETTSQVSRTKKVMPELPPDMGKKVMSEQERKEAKAKMWARIQALQKRAKDKAKAEKQEVVKEAVDRSQQSRERLKMMEEERLAKLRAKIVEKNERTQKQVEQQRQGREKAKDLSTKHVFDKVKPPPRNRPQPTIPKEPKFATSHRHRATNGLVEKQLFDEMVPLACCGDMLMRGLRAPLPRQPGSSSTKRTLTIPQAPRFATSQRHGDKTPTTSPQKLHFSDDSSWYSTLRDGTVSPTSKIASSVKTGPLTVPQTPNFQPSRQRPLPKSTAEKEREEMEYFNSHPFRARPVRLEPLPSRSLLSKKSSHAPRRLTTPEPFSLRTDARVERSTHPDDDAHEEPSNQFKARPMPDFGGNHITPITDQPTAIQTQFTTPEPFHFHATSKGAAYPSVVHQKNPPTSTIRGKIPSGASGIKFQHKSTTKWTPSSRVMGTTKAFASKKSSPPKPEITPFKARPVPSFIPKTIQITKNADIDPNDAEGHQSGGFSSPLVTDAKPFKARPMPNFEKVDMPVHQRDASKIRSPPLQMKDDETPLTVFHARPLPKSLTKDPAIRVKERNPKKLRSPESVRRHDQPPATEEMYTFHALPVPHYILAEPTIPVRSREGLSSPKSIENLEMQLSSDAVVAATSFEDRQIPSTITHPRISLRDSVKNPVEQIMASPRRGQSLADPLLDGAGMDRQDAKARLKQRLAMRKAAKNMEQKKSKSPADIISPRAFTAAKVKDRLSRGAAGAKSKEDSRRVSKSSIKATTTGDDVPDTISLPLRSPAKQTVSPVPKAHSTELIDATMKTPRAGNARIYPDSPTGDLVSNSAATHYPEVASDAAAASVSLVRNPELDANLEREAVLACALAEPDADDSSSILQLAKEIQKAAEDELSFHGSLHSSIDPRGNYGY